MPRTGAMLPTSWAEQDLALVHHVPADGACPAARRRRGNG